MAPAPQPLTQVKVDARALFRRSPAAVVGSFLAGIIFGNWAYFGPLYGRAVGLTDTGIATMLTAAMIGGMAFQVPFGRLSDRIDRRYVMALAGAIGVAVSAAMVIFAPTNPYTIVLGMFALGSVLFTIYALNVAHANDQAEAHEFVQVSGGLLIVYGIGNMVGPQLGGRLMDQFGPKGFFVAMGIVYAVIRPLCAVAVAAEGDDAPGRQDGLPRRSGPARGVARNTGARCADDRRRSRGSRDGHPRAGMRKHAAEVRRALSKR